LSAQPRILVVDDDDMVAAIFETALTELGLPAAERVADGADAIALLDAGQAYDIIFTDIYMPQVDGIELLQHLARTGFPGAVVLMTGVDFIRMLQDQGLEAPVTLDAETGEVTLKTDGLFGADERINLVRVMGKPFRLAELAAAFAAAGWTVSGDGA